MAGAGRGFPAFGKFPRPLELVFPALPDPFAMLAGLLVLAAVAAGTAAIRRRRFMARRRGAAATADARVLVAWEEAEEALGLAGHPRRLAKPAQGAAEMIQR